jgi:hypothetical protein
LVSDALSTSFGALRLLMSSDPWKSGAGAHALQNLAVGRQPPWRAKRLGVRARQRRFGPEPGVVAQPEELGLTPLQSGGCAYALEIKPSMRYPQL